MSLQSDRARLVQRIQAELGRWKVSDGVDVARFAVFAREAVARMRGPFLTQRAPREVLTALEEAFTFALVRPVGVALTVVRPAAGGRGVVAIANLDDQPFIVDTLRLVLRRAGGEPLHGFNIVFRCERDATGAMIGVGGAGGTTESLALFMTEEPCALDADTAKATADLSHAIQLARAAVRDFHAMRVAMQRVIEKADALGSAHPSHALEETASFLRWLTHENFVFMGMVTDEAALGIESIEGPFRGSADGVWPDPHPPGTVFVRRSSMKAPIHREGRVDELKIVLGAGTASESTLFVRGMFTLRGVSQPTRNVPIVRGVLRAEFEAQEAQPGSFRYKSLANAFDSLPTEFVFTSSRESIAQMMDTVLESESTHEPAATVLPRADGSVFCLVTMPKGDYSDDMRRELQARVLDALRAPHADYGVYIGRYDTVLLHFYLPAAPDRDPATVVALEDSLRRMAQPWPARLWAAAESAYGEEHADALVAKYQHAFPAAYTSHTTPTRALVDIACMEALSSANPVVADLFEDVDDSVTLRVYQSGNVYLTQIVPVLDDFGLRVIRSVAVQVDLRGEEIEFDSFTLACKGADREAILRNRDLLLQALPAVFAGQVETDPLSALVVSAGIDVFAVDVLRAYSRYLRQLQVNVTVPRIQTILVARSDVMRRLYDLFRARFDPAITSRRDEHLAVATDALDELLRRVRTHDEDLVLGGLNNLIQATLRTNAFRDDRVSHYLSFKFECARVRDMRGQRPLYEIYVHSRQVEGVHLRFGKVARGGLRWSDRADYRTEVLGLVTTQQVKNVVIVPEGSKGGFFLREPDKDGAVRRKQADLLYETFIRGLLDLTDNVVAGKTVHPPSVVCLDGDDPYLVVAADKGTAHLSDTANRLSLAYGHWLGDAFASGGSHGYDHKVVGITARGGWVLVRRLFAELGKDPYSEPFTAIGIGDMSGDVYGNGLIESPHTRLLAAFNHVHLFLDPDPDTARSYAERKRLFDAGGRLGGWDQYDLSTVSAGGGVYDRASKSVPLSEQAAAMLGLTPGDTPPEDVIQAILKMEVDLLWSGGIGTYVKASTETHDDADDRGNDRFRIDASALRVKVVGEGANLSFTQAGRIEAAQHGVRLNTDFIDNSGGVDLSDHEVNLKILLREPGVRGELDFDARNVLLAELTDEVASLVLADNAVQGLQISRDELRSKKDIYPFARAISFIERYFGVTRKVWTLPDEDELGRRARAGTGLTRPELATLSAHVKRFVYAELLMSGRARSVFGHRDFLVNYFPKAIQQRYLPDVLGHQLADEIAMTVATTRVVGDAGASFVPMAVDFSGRGVVDVVDAYLRALDVARADDVRGSLEALGPASVLPVRYKRWIDLDFACRAVAAYWLGAGATVPSDDALPAITSLVDVVWSRLPEADRASGAPSDAMDPIAALRIRQSAQLATALLVLEQPASVRTHLDDAATLQLAAGRASRLQDIAAELRARPAHGEWEPIATQILANRLLRLLRDLVSALPRPPAGTLVEDLEPALAAGALAPVRAQIDAMLGQRGGDLATLLVLEERIASAIAGLRSAA